MNRIGVGNSSELVTVETQLNNPVLAKTSSNDSAKTGAIAGGVSVGLVFAILLVVVFYISKRRADKKEHAKSVLVSLQIILLIKGHGDIMRIYFFACDIFAII